ncbi:MAG: hypothetical protein K6A96_02950 [Prevotella sp.]|nr:hypothetical protein [Prevotella sp.]
MKKLLFFGMLGAMTLTFSACSSDDAVVENNPTFDGTNVRADFAFNIAKASQTRMSATNVQESGNFRGIENAFLFPFKGEPKTGNLTAFAKNYSLGAIEGISATASSKVYPLSIPVGTDNFLFYAEATNNSEGNFKIGLIDHNLKADLTDVSTLYFNLHSIYSDNETAIKADQKTLADYLTAIANAKVTDDITWAGTVEKAATDGNYQILAQLYKNFTTLYTNELRSGSADNVKRTVRDLYRSVTAIVSQSGNTAVTDIADAIVAAINLGTDGVFDIESGSEGTTELKYNDTELAKFPGKYFLPDGAAMLKWTGSAFEYDANPYYAAGLVGTTETNARVGIAGYTYPAEIIYFDNSPLRASDEYKEVADYPKTVPTWDGTGFDWVAQKWTDNAVKASTRAVAMTNNVNYGVALLESTLQIASGITSMDDNRGAILKRNNATTVAPEDETFTIDDKSFTLKGILIGGQPARVGWNLVSSENNRNQVIYDTDLTFTDIKVGTPSAANYTLALDNWTSANKQEDVLVAIELVNNLKDANNNPVDFYGKENLIPAGGVFYLVTKLSIDNAKAWDPVVRPNTYRVTNEDVARVFLQDYKTKAKFTITADALKNAYNTVPDLRATMVTFGLSVDLTWEPGLEFEANF